MAKMAEAARELLNDREPTTRDKIVSVLPYLFPLVDSLQFGRFLIAENQDNPKALWNSFKKILHKSSTLVLPDYTNKTDLANTFCNFFYNKIIKIRSAFHAAAPALVARSNSQHLLFFHSYI